MGEGTIDGSGVGLGAELEALPHAKTMIASNSTANNLCMRPQRAVTVSSSVPVTITIVDDIDFNGLSLLTFDCYGTDTDRSSPSR